MQHFQAAYQLPGVAGAINGTVICMQKPPAKLSGCDSVEYWNYKGHCAMLLLAVVDQALLFTYINTGAPGNIGDAGLYRRYSLYEQMQQELLDCMPVQ
jgi:hypothetical protein